MRQARAEVEIIATTGNDGQKRRPFQHELTYVFSRSICNVSKEFFYRMTEPVGWIALRRNPMNAAEVEFGRHVNFVRMDE
ncbi:unnamed protein product [Soboliphyme baturini]|uniref:Helitron helicase n=1 Tax=Soboliphyme baturini TaxID=241478 RepID=A0A183IHS9_9BILA|nr:unnamed protein product [Soboliphyme baturini]